MKLMSKAVVGGGQTTSSSRDPPEHLQDGPPQRCSSGGWIGLTGTQKHWVVGDDANGRRGGKEMVQVSAGNRAELLLQVGTLRLRHAGSHRQTLRGE